MVTKLYKCMHEALNMNLALLLKTHSIKLQVKVTKQYKHFRKLA